jgi:hypothetical protein
VKDGGNLLSVHCDTGKEVSRAKDLLKVTGAMDIASTHESAGIRRESADAEAAGRDPNRPAVPRYAADTRQIRDPGVVPTVRESIDTAPAADPSNPRIYR